MNNTRGIRVAASVCCIGLIGFLIHTARAAESYTENPGSEVAFTPNPWGRAVFGCSSGGAAALSMAWFRPDLFRRVIACSGTFVDQQDDDAPEESKYPLGAWEYHSSMKLIEKSEKKPLRIFAHVSKNDNHEE